MSLRIGFLGLMAMLGLLPALNAQAAESRHFGPFEVEQVSLLSLTADLRVHAGETTRLVIKGDPEVLDAINIDTTARALTVRQKPFQFTTVVIGPNGSVVNQGGTVTIGGHPINSAQGSDPIEVGLHLKPGTALAIDDLIGSASVHDLDALFEAGLTSGAINAGKVGPAKLNIPGSGDILVKSVRENLEVDIPGNGSATIEEGDVETARIAIAGAGKVHYKGRAQDASVSIPGAGTVEMGPVTNRPAISVTGSGEVSIANW